MTSTQAVEFANFFADLSQRSANPDFDLSTIRDIVETMHVATKEPEGVTYAEVDAGGVEALWCIPAGSDPHSVLLHNHMGGSVITSMYSDRKAAAHIAKAAGVRSLVLNFRRSPEHKYPAQIDDVETAYRWLLGQGHRPQNIASVGHSIGGYLAVGLGATTAGSRRRTPRRASCRSLPGATSRCRRNPLTAMLIGTSCSRAGYWSFSGPPGSTEPAWTGPTRRSICSPPTCPVCLRSRCSTVKMSCSPARPPTSRSARKQRVTTSLCDLLKRVSTPSSSVQAGCPK